MVKLRKLRTPAIFREYVHVQELILLNVDIASTGEQHSSNLWTILFCFLGEHV